MASAVSGGISRLLHRRERREASVWRLLQGNHESRSGPGSSGRLSVAGSWTAGLDSQCSARRLHPHCGRRLPSDYGYRRPAGRREPGQCGGAEDRIPLPRRTQRLLLRRSAPAAVQTGPGRTQAGVPLHGYPLCLHHRFIWKEPKSIPHLPRSISAPFRAAFRHRPFAGAASEIHLPSSWHFPENHAQ